jgi:hypothetical protein
MQDCDVSPAQRLDDERKAIGQVVPWPTVELHPLAVLPGDGLEAPMLDFMQSPPEDGCLALMGRQGGTKPGKILNTAGDRASGRCEVKGCELVRVRTTAATNSPPTVANVSHAVGPYGGSSQTRTTSKPLI